MRESTCFIAIILCFFLFINLSYSQQENYAKIRLFTEKQNIQHLHEIGLDIDHLQGHGDGTIDFFINHKEFKILEEHQLHYEVLIDNWRAYYAERSEIDAKIVASKKKQARTATNFDYGSMGGFYTLGEIESKMDDMYTLYPNLVKQKDSIGTSIEGRTIWALKISDNPAVDESEPTVYYDALHHAREPLSMAVTINYMFWLLENYETNPEVAYLIDNRELYFVPCVNPDGYEYNRLTDPSGGGLWRKNKKNNGAGCYGVDLNRNYSFGYDYDSTCASTSTCSNTYKGKEAFSEPETNAIRNFIASINPQSASSIHSTAGYYLMPYGYDTSPPEFGIYSEWATDFLSENDYPYGVNFEMLGYTSCGTTRDYLYSQGIYSWTPEIDGSGFWPAQSEIFELVDENVIPMLYQAWIAGGYTDIQSHTRTGDAVPGGNFTMTVEVKNKGIGAASSNVNVSISCLDPKVSIIGNGLIGAIPPRSKMASPVFTISIDSAFSGGAFDLYLIVSEEGIPTDTSIITIPIGSTTLLFSDNAELGNDKWTSSGTGKSWGIVEDDSYGGSLSFGDSNNGNAANNTSNYFTLSNELNLTTTSNPKLEFYSKWSLEAGDHLSLQGSMNGGSTWTTIKNYSQNQSWQQELIDLSSWKNSIFKFRFWLQTDGSVPGDGFYFDDITVKDYNCPDCPICDSALDAFPSSESFEKSLGDWTQGNEDDLDWTINSNGTLSSKTGPSGAIDGLYYVYVEASSPNYPSKTASLESPCLDLLNWVDANLSFQYHMFGTSTKMNLKVEVSIDGGSTWSLPIWQISGNQGNQWNTAIVDLSSYSGSFLKIRLYGTTGETWQGDIAIDIPVLTATAGCTRFGDPCDDANSCTDNDAFDSNCNCLGTLIDGDNDGICDEDDICPDFDDSLIGSPCDDGDSCTMNDIYGTDCSCSGLFQDSDNDGICDAIDPTNGDCTLGGICDDNDSCTVNDGYDSNCNCLGTIIDSDNDGVCDADDLCPNFDDSLIGTSCDDGDPCTIGETFDSSCVCLGGTILDEDNNGICDLEDNCQNSFPLFEGFENGIGSWTQSSNDDIDWTQQSGQTPSVKTGPNTANEGSYYLYMESSNPNYPTKTAGLESECLNLFNAESASLLFAYHMYGTSKGMKIEVQISVDDGVSWLAPIWSLSNNQGDQWTQVIVDLSTYLNQSINIRLLGTTGDYWQGDIAIDNVAISVIILCEATGDPCDDGDSCTFGDEIDSSCNCTGITQDSDNDGFCDIEDMCPDFDNNLIGTPCDDNDPCNEGEIWDNDCECSGGNLLDNNNNGICDLEEDCNYNTVDFNDFELGFATWNDGGSDCIRTINDALYAYSGSYCIRLRDNSSTSILTSNIYDLIAYEEITIEFTYITNSMDNGNEDFWLQVSHDGGNNYTTVEEWNFGDEFENNKREFENVIIQGPFTNSMKFRFRCDASSNSDMVYLDDVEILGCSLSADFNEHENLVGSTESRSNSNQLGNLHIFPNPTLNTIYLKVNNLEVYQSAQIQVFSTIGERIASKMIHAWDGKQLFIDMTGYDVGIYFLRVIVNGKSSTKRFVKN